MARTGRKYTAASLETKVHSHKMLAKCLSLFLSFLLLCSFGMTVSGEEAPDSDGWELTEYPDMSGNQGMFYSLYHPKTGVLILVDGGTGANADLLHETIETHGGHVSAWFLTHYHVDHIGAFITVYETIKDQIDVIYVNPLDWETFE